MSGEPKSTETQIAELERAIAALEGQRAVLGETVVASALAAMQSQLAALRAQATEQRKLVTVLFADLVGFTALSETLDPEDVRELQQDYFGRWRRAIEQQGGVVEKFIGDAVMALFGVPAAREDDAERGVRAALALHAALAELNAARQTALQMRVGVHTGLVLVAGGSGDFVATGDTVNVAARLQANAPPGGTLISHSAYQHVRGLFEVTAQQPLALKGKAEPLQTYLVIRPLPAAFRTTARGVEGVETRMVGREVELLALQRAYADAVDDAAVRIVVVVGEPGLGKSRLAYEFSLWLADQSERAPLAPLALRARAMPQSSATPAALLRDLFSQHFGLYDTDSAAEVVAKFRAGAAGRLEPDQADILGQFCGYDFSGSEAVRRLLGQDALANLGQVYLAQYLEALGQARPLVLLLEDLHWADDRSLDALLALAAPGRLAAPLLAIGLVRPAFFERRPHWAEGQAAVTRLPLNPLSRRDSRDLVAEILQKAEQLPDSLRDLIVTASEGNPFFAEELVKMLVDDRVIVVAADIWQVAADRVAGVRVPPTLAGVLQARLDSLPAPERDALQRAAVVGREFWDEAVARLSGQPSGEALGPILATLRGRELVYRHEHSAFAATTEFAFKHALLRDVIYETVLRRLRRAYHGQVAEWMESRAGERLAEHAGLIAYHYQQAEAAPQALRFLTLAADTALNRYANAEAAAYYQQALAVGPAPGARARLLDSLGRALDRQGDFEGAIAAWREAAERYRAEGNTDRAARLYARISRAYWSLQDMPAYLAAARAGLQALAGAPVSPGLAALHHEVGRAANFSGHIDEGYAQTRQALEMAEEIGALDVEADTLATWGVLPQLSYADRVAALRRAVALAEDAGLLVTAMRAHNNLGYVLDLFGDDQPASVAGYRRASQIARQRGSVEDEVFFLANIMHGSCVAGDLAGARQAVERLRHLAQAQPDSQRLRTRFQSGEADWLRFEGSLEHAIQAWQACGAAIDATNDPQGIGWLYWNLGSIFFELGALEQAEAAFARTIEADPGGKDLSVGLFGRSWLVQVYAAQGRTAEAEAVLRDAEAMVGEDPPSAAAILLRLARAALALAHSEWDNAFSNLRANQQSHQQAGRHWLANYVHLYLADAYLRRGAAGDRAQARAALTEAQSAFRKMGADAYVARLQARLDALHNPAQ